MKITQTEYTVINTFYTPAGRLSEILTDIKQLHSLSQDYTNLDDLLPQSTTKLPTRGVVRTKRRCEPPTSIGMQGICAHAGRGPTKV